MPHTFDAMNYTNVPEMATIPVQEQIAMAINLTLKAYGLPKESLKRRPGKKKLVIIEPKGKEKNDQTDASLR